MGLNAVAPQLTNSVLANRLAALFGETVGKDAAEPDGAMSECDTWNTRPGCGSCAWSRTAQWPVRRLPSPHRDHQFTVSHGCTR